jgi:hypothetical protein
MPVPSLRWSFEDDDHPNITSHTTQFPQRKIVNASIAAIVSHPNMVELCDAYGGQSLPLVPPVALNQLLPLVIAMADDGNLSRTVFPRMGLYCLFNKLRVKACVRIIVFVCVCACAPARASVCECVCVCIIACVCV